METANSNQSRFEHYFGKIPKGIQDHDDPYQHETHNLPEAYLGKNRFLMQTFDYLITKEGREFLTRDILPFEHTDNINVAWEVFQFDKTIADIEPEQGMPRYVTQSHDMYSDTLTRRGLAFVIEHGFYTTEIGKKHYLMNIQQIVDAVSDTCSYQVIRALLDEEDHYTQQDFNETNKDIIRREMSRFGIVQRGEHGMHILDSDLKDAMSMEGITPTAYIFPARMSSYIRMRDPYMTEHSRGGAGLTNLAADPAVLTFRGTRVYECRYFETDYIEAPFDPLENDIVYNEYYIEDDGCDLYVFDMKADNWCKASGNIGDTEDVTPPAADGSGDAPTTGRRGFFARLARAFGATGGAFDRGTTWLGPARDGPRSVVLPSVVLPSGAASGAASGGNLLTQSEFDGLSLRRFKEKTLPEFNASFFGDSVSSATAAKVVGELRMLSGTDTVIRPKFLEDLFATHATP